MILIVDGPEAAGKTTLIRAIGRQLTRPPLVRAWGPVDSVHEYWSPLQADLANEGDLVVWDRSWASEFVYNRLLRRGRSESTILEEATGLEEDVWESAGVLLMVIALPEALHERRAQRRALKDLGDLPVRPEDEARHFAEYAVNHEWAMLPGDRDPAVQARWVLDQLNR